MKALFYSLIICFCFVSCCNDSKKIIITDFSKQRTDTLTPCDWKELSPFHPSSYIMYIIKVKGYTNDTIKIKHQGWFDIKLSGQIDTIIRTDYYGTFDMIPTFLPYKATKGKIKIEYKL